tara:strand:+ start:236 stop:790 length:555 start_codon:yes stop_codon:yes gene_type:complete
MKRLLLAPLLIAGLQNPANALPWGNDIVIKTDVGEKFIVKESTVSTIDKTKDSVIREIQRSIVNSRKGYEKCLSSKLGNRYCNHSWDPEETEERYRQYIKEVKENFPDKKLSVDIYFKAIYQDLNGNKRPQPRQLAYCINKTLSKENQDFLNTWQGLKPGNTNSYALNIKEQLKFDVCEKYAKF